MVIRLKLNIGIINAFTLIFISCLMIGTISFPIASNGSLANNTSITNDNETQIIANNDVNNTNITISEPQYTNSVTNGVIIRDPSLNDSNIHYLEDNLLTTTSTKLSCYTSAKFINITYSGSSSLTDYQMMYIIHKCNGTDNGKDIYLNGTYQNWNDYPNDIRFTDIDGNLLDYWVETSNTSQATVWVEVNNIPPGGCNIMMYYGSNESSLSNGENAFPFFDDFNFLSPYRWSDLGGSTTSNGELTISSTNNINKGITSNYLFGTGYTVRAKIKSAHFSHSSYSERFGLQNMTPLIGNNAGSIADYSDNDLNDKGKYRNRLPNEQMWRSSIIGWTAGQYQIQEIQRRSYNATYIINDNGATLVSSSSCYYPLFASIIAHTNFNGASISIDWIAVRKCSDVEPGYGPVTLAFSPYAHAVGVYRVNMYIPGEHQTYSLRSIDELYDTISTVEGWKGSWEVSDDDVKANMFTTDSGTDYRRVDYVDLAFFAGHGLDGTICLYYNNNYQYVYLSDCSFGRFHAKWIGFESCLIGNDTDSCNMSMNGLHELMTYNTVCVDEPYTMGYYWSMYMTMPNYTIMQAWFDACNMCDPLNVSTTVFYADGCRDDYLYGFGPVGPDPDAITPIYNRVSKSNNTTIRW